MSLIFLKDLDIENINNIIFNDKSNYYFKQRLMVDTYERLLFLIKRNELNKGLIEFIVLCISNIFNKTIYIDQLNDEKIIAIIKNLRKYFKYSN
jgi:hypothetical protein